MQGDFVIIISAFPSVAGVTVMRCGRLLVVANAALNLQPNKLFFQEKKKKKKKTSRSNLRKNLDNNFTKNLDSFLSKKFTTKLFKIIIMEKKADATPEVPPDTFEVPAAPIQVCSKVKTNMAFKKSWPSCGW